MGSSSGYILKLKLKVYKNPLKFHLKLVFGIGNINPKTPDTNCQSVFLIEKPVFNGLLNIFGAQNQLPITFCPDLVNRYKNCMPVTITAK